MTPGAFGQSMGTSVGAAPTVPAGIADRIDQLGESVTDLAERQQELAALAGISEQADLTWSEVFNGYAVVLIAAFLVTLVVTPLMRRLAVANGVIDRPSDPRKIHRMPIAYLGGVAVYLGIMAGIIVSYLGVQFDGLVRFHATTHLVDGHPELVPPWIVLGLTTIMLIGLLDDVIGISPRVKIGGQIFAAAALAYGQIGVNVAAGLLGPTLGELVGNRELTYTIDLPQTLPILTDLFGTVLELDIIYWTGTAVIAFFVLGGCNASNLIDGLDGLCSGLTAIAALGLLAIAIMMVSDPTAAGRLDSARIVLCLAVLGSCLGFLPHNFNPATIFLGDCGSLLLGFIAVVIILTLGDTGRTDLVVAGLLIYAVPVIDTVLAIIRRKMAGKSMSEPDSEHLHHMLKRTFGVKGAALSLYGIAIGFALIGVLMAATNARLIYTLALFFAAFICTYAMKIARRKQIEEQALSYDRRAVPVPAGQAGKPATRNDPAPEPAPPPEATTANA